MQQHSSLQLLWLQHMAYRLEETTILGRKCKLPGLDRPLRHEMRFRKLWQESTYPASKTGVNWITKTIKRMTLKKHLNDGKQSKL
jgi:hypothetical protein